MKYFRNKISRRVYEALKDYLFPTLFLMTFFTGFSQGIIVDDESYGSQALSQLLMNGGCVEVFNASYSSAGSVAYFEGNESDFPLEEGVIIRTGKAKYSEGQYTGNNLSSSLNNDSDPFLEEITNAEGQSVTIRDVAFLQFDFIPLASNFQFNFLFASNEYGEWQCVSNDAFAFLLTNLDTEVTENLALIPNTSTPISVKNVRDNAYNAGCNSQNSSYFDKYNVDEPFNSSVNMNGFTQVLTASTDLTPGATYRIRLVIGDANDDQFDSAVFLQGGSFNTDLDLGGDRMICGGEEVELSTGLSTSEYAHVWKRNGTVLPETGATLMVTQVGTYTVEVQRTGGECEISDTVTISELIVEPPQNISVCDSGSGTYTFNLTQNNALALGLSNSDYKVYYYASLEDAQNDHRIPNSLINQYVSPSGVTVYIRIYSQKTGHLCGEIYSFELDLNAKILEIDPEDIGLCFIEGGYQVDLTQIEAEVLSNQPYNDLLFYYYDDYPSEMLESDELPQPDNYELPTDFESHVIWVIVVDPNDEDCFVILSFQIIEYPEVPVSEIEDAIECLFYELPEIENGEYYSSPDGQGTQYEPGDVLDSEGYYYIYNFDEETGCFSQTSFKVILIDQYDEAEGTFCGEFVLPEPPAGDFYTAPGGPNGDGEIIPPGTVIESSTTVYYYAEIDGELCRDDSMEIEILPLPVIDAPIDQVACEYYVLPALSGGDYYTEPGGGGQMLNAGTQITTSQTLYVFEDDGFCASENSFEVIIVPEFEDIEVCGSYILPELEIGGFYTDSKGQGENIPEGTEITESQKIYYYTQTTQSPNCTNYRNFYVTVHPIPEVENFPDTKICKGEIFELPELEYGDYFTEPNREGEQLFAGDTLSVNQQIFINNREGNCENETSFTFEIVELPPIANFTDIYTCYPYTIPLPSAGKIYTEPGGQGNMVHPGTQIYTTKTFYIYNELTEPPYCHNEEQFTVHVDYVNVGEFDDIKACDFYVLPELDSGHYYTEGNGAGDTLFAGDTLVQSQKIFVFDQKGDRFVCIDEASFEVEISSTPELPEFEDIEICGSYTLPSLEMDYAIDYYWQPNGEGKINPEDYEMLPGEYEIFVRGEAFENANCYDETSFNLVIHPLLEMDIPDAVICVDIDTGELLDIPLLSSGVDETEYDIDWFLGEEWVHAGVEFEPTEPGTYTVTATRIGGEEGVACDYEPYNVLVRAVSKAEAIAHVTPDFSDVAIIEVEITQGNGNYVFNLDGGSYQTDPFFYDVSSGLHIINIKDASGKCGITVLKVAVIKYPKYFTPNGDGVNDTWNIPDLKKYQDVKIYIFNRYGKLLRTIKPNGEGWDGTYKGRPLPSADYWFKAEYRVEGELREFKANFTLKR